MVRDLSEVVNLYIHMDMDVSSGNPVIQGFECAMPGQTFRVEVNNQQGKPLQVSSKTLLVNAERTHISQQIVV